MKLLAKLQASKEFWFLLITSVVFFLLRFPSLFEPYWYGDEGIYEVIGFALRHGRFLYTGIWDNKPPLLYLIYTLFSGDQSPVRLLSLLAGLGATIAIYFLSKKLFAKFAPAALATVLFSFLFGIPLIEGNIANAENFMLLPNIMAGFLVYSSLQTNTKHALRTILPLFIAGLLLGFSCLTKVVALFDLSAFAVFAFIVSFQSFAIKDIFSAVKRIIPLVIGFLIPLILCSVYFVAHHAFKEFFHSTLSSNVGYVNYANQFIIPQGFLILKTLILGLISLGFLLFRKKISKEFLFIVLWLAFSVYNSLFSGRPYTHYALVLLPSMILLVGLLVAQKKIRIVSTALLIATILFLAKSFTYYGILLGIM